MATPPDNHWLVLENRHTGEKLRMRRVNDPESGEVLEVEGHLPAATEGPPLHRHFRLREETTVLTGELSAHLDGETLAIKPGETTVFPPGSRHTWWNAGDEALAFRGRAIPAGDLDRYLQGVFALVNASPTGRPPLFPLAHLLWRHRRTQAVLSPPRALQAVLLPLLVGLGSLLGKYNGSEWPASPSSCRGAPKASGNH
ncbi:MAG: cupin domain-containing protein [Chthoniobacterales bacterium]|jgi:quercetin dioxygenase-like cupin family protein